MNVIITDPKGFYFNGQKHAEGAEIDLPPGARLDAAKHFQQVKAVKEKPAKENEAPSDPKKGKGDEAKK